MSRLSVTPGAISNTMDVFSPKERVDWMDWLNIEMGLLPLYVSIQQNCLGFESEAVSVGLLSPSEADQELSRAIQAADRSPAGTIWAVLAFLGTKTHGKFAGNSKVLRLTFKTNRELLTSWRRKGCFGKPEYSEILLLAL